MTKAKRVLSWLRRLLSKTLLTLVSSFAAGLILFIIPKEKIYLFLKDNGYASLEKIWLLIIAPRISAIELIAFFLLLWFVRQIFLLRDKYKKEKNMISRLIDDWQNFLGRSHEIKLICEPEEPEHPAYTYIFGERQQGYYVKIDRTEDIMIEYNKLKSSTDNRVAYLATKHPLLKDLSDKTKDIDISPGYSTFSSENEVRKKITAALKDTINLLVNIRDAIPLLE